MPTPAPAGAPAPSSPADPATVRWQQWVALASVGLAAVVIAGLWLDAAPWAWACALVACGIGALLLLRFASRQTSRLSRSRSLLADLRSLQRQYGAAEHMAGLGLWVIDVESQTIRWSEGCTRLLGASSDGRISSIRGFIIHLHPDDQQRWQEAMRRATANGVEVKLEFRYLRPSGGQLWVRSVARPQRDAEGQVTRLAGIMQDISGMRAMQQQLAASENKFRELTSMSSDWVWETNERHELSFISDSVDHVLGAWIRARMGKTRWEQESPFGRADWSRHRADLEARKPIENFEYSALDPEGHLFHLSISGRAVFSESGKFLGYRGTGRDITKEKEQRIQLEIESDLAQIMREQTEPDRILTATIIRVCGPMGWSGGAHLVRVPGALGFQVRERWGYPPVTKMLSDLPQLMLPLPNTVESQAWLSGQPVWLHNIDSQPGLVARYQAMSVGIRALFYAPIHDEAGQVMSLLLFFAPIGHRNQRFLSTVAEGMGRTLSLYLQRQAAEQRLKHASLHDGLTKLPNRVYVNHLLDDALRNHRPLALLYIDLDRYKLINDTLGHSAGDQVLIEVAQRFQDSIGQQDIAGRMGGDEFVILLWDQQDRDAVEAIARKVLAAIEKPFILQNRAYFLSASIGVAVAPQDGTEGSLLLKCADAAMYQVKAEGRNDVRFFAGGLSDERSEQLQLASELPLAIQRGEVDLYYQPVLSVGDRKVVGYEALLRWHHPQRGMLLPDRFLPMAEQSNLIREIGLWAIRRALDDRAALGLEAYPDLAVSVNVSAKQLGEDGFLATLNALLLERNLPARLLRLELTESSVIEAHQRNLALIAELRRMGIQVIIDNFGTGYASLSYLKNLPVDGLKIDHQFIKNLPNDRGNAAIIQSVTTLAARLGLFAMAEGVETNAEMKALRSFECEQMQGTLISEPLPFSELKEFLQTLPDVRQMHLVSTQH
jgi:diguanylate cyclase (GGDEF)-like protein/PAS domain S-box-containing protein